MSIFASKRAVISGENSFSDAEMRGIIFAKLTTTYVPLRYLVYQRLKGVENDPTWNLFIHMGPEMIFTYFHSNC